MKFSMIWVRGWWLGCVVGCVIGLIRNMKIKVMRKSRVVMLYVIFGWIVYNSLLMLGLVMVFICYVIELIVIVVGRIVWGIRLGVSVE